MGTARSNTDASAPPENRSGNLHAPMENDMPAQLSPQDADLRTRIIQHCREMWELEPDYARAAYDDYREQLPWLGIPERKR